MAICNTVVVNTKPRMDTIEEEGFIEDGLFTVGNSTFLSSLTNEAASAKEKGSPCADATVEAVDERFSEEAEWTLGQRTFASGSSTGTPSPAATARLDTASRGSSFSQRLYDLPNEVLQFSKKLVFYTNFE
ncbi:unnamed protein product [Gongylonema pulchrum]|uniref:Uncharacterized protein n=1 Tax=Gongylonema pulchrum TaxID=637853 RepID=A0A183ER78_9BILA|nr:unnamed protein product [Gongylonema pulchrum]